MLSQMYSVDAPTDGAKIIFAQHLDADAVPDEELMGGPPRHLDGAVVPPHFNA